MCAPGSCSAPGTQESPMARLTADQRRRLAPNAFAGPNRSFPVDDAAHARAAIMLSKYASDPARVKAKGEAVLRRGG
ncbi:MAG: hypothetical protein ACREQ5_20600 [Candidatus Dormibacteria bacterium]